MVVDANPLSGRSSGESDHDYLQVRCVGLMVSIDPGMTEIVTENHRGN